MLSSIYRSIVAMVTKSERRPDRAPYAAPLIDFDRRILNYLGDGDPTAALLISGKWGAGKTYYLNSKKNALAAASGKRVVMTSIAGLASRAELDQALFMASAPWLFTGYSQALGVFFKAGLRFAKIEPKDFKFTAEFSSGGVLVVLDDVDRFAGDFRIVSGLIIDLVDQSKLHTIVVASEDNVGHFAEFGTWRERVVGTTVCIVPDIADMLDAFVKELGDQAVRDKVDEFRPLLLQIATEWGAANLRSLRHAIRDLARVIGAIGVKLDKLGDFKKTLVGALFIGLLEIRRDASRTAAVAKVFSHQGLSEVAQELLAGISVEEGSLAEEDGVFVSGLVKRYSSYEFSLFPGGDAFASFFERGVIDADGMIGAFSHLAVPTRRSLLVSNYLQLSQTEFEEELSLLLEDLRTHAITSMNEIAQAFLALRSMALRRAISLSDEEVCQLTVDSIRGVVALNVSDANVDEDDFWFVRSPDEFNVRVQEEINRKRDEARAALTLADRAAVFQTLQTGRPLSDRLREWKLIPLFVGNADLVVQAAGEMTPSEVQDLLKHFASRRKFSDFIPRLHEEEATLREIAEKLRAQLEGKKVLTLRESQIDQLASVMSSFADDLSRYQSP